MHRVDEQLPSIAMSNTPKPSRGTILRLVSLASLTMLGVVASCASMPGNKIIDGAKVVLAGLCETLPTPQLDLARQQLELNDLASAARHLRAELDAHGHQPDVAALLALIESQIPPPVLAPEP